MLFLLLFYDISAKTNCLKNIQSDSEVVILRKFCIVDHKNDLITF